MTFCDNTGQVREKVVVVHDSAASFSDCRQTLSVLAVANCLLYALDGLSDLPDVDWNKALFGKVIGRVWAAVVEREAEAEVAVW